MTEEQKTAAENFAKVAREYCAWAEGELGEPKAAAVRARQLLAGLHLEILKLRMPDLDDSDSEVEDKLSREFDVDEHFKMCAKFRGGMPIEGCLYWGIF